MKKLVFLPLVSFLTFNAYSQLKIGNNPTTINSNSILELESTNKGLLLPRVALESTNSAAPLSGFVAGMLVYNTATTGDVLPGFYVSSSTRWTKLDNQTGVNIYNSDGTLTEARTITMGSNGLYFQGAGEIYKYTGNSSVAPSINLGRTGGEAHFAVAASNGHGLSGTTAGDAVLSTSGNLVMGPAILSKSIKLITANNERLTILPSGNVGIANTNPTEKLDVTGNVKFSGALMPNNTAGTSGQVLTSAGAGAVPTWTTLPTSTNIYNSDGTLTAARTITMGSNGLYFQGAGEIYKYTGNSSVAPSINLGRTGGEAHFAVAASNGHGLSGTTAGDAVLSTSGNLVMGPAILSKSIKLITANNERLTILPSGNVGIANTNPTEKLDVTGNVKFSGALMPNNTAGTSGQVLTSAGAGAVPTWTTLPTSTNIYNSDGTLTAARTITMGSNGLYFQGAGEIYKYTGNSSVAPSINLGRTGGEAHFAVAASNGHGLSGTTAGDAVLSTSGNLVMGPAILSKSIKLITANNERLTILPSGNVGIANTNPTEKLDVTGNVKFSGALMPNNTAGTSGQVLTSAGAGAVPTWTTLPTPTTYTGSTSVTLNGTSFERAALTGDVTATANSNALTIANNAVTSAKIADGTITAADLNQMSATTGQILKWNGTTWAPAADNDNSSAITSLQSDVQQLNSDLNDLENQMNNTNSNFSTQISQINNTNSTQTAQINNLTNQMNVLHNQQNTQISDLSNQVSILHNQQADEIDNLTNQLNSDISDLSNAIDNPTVSNSITGNQLTTTVNGTTSTAVTLPSADGSETKVTAGSNVTITGTGTTASPYVVNAAGAADATTTSNGVVRLAGDLSGTAAAPTVANDAITSAKIADGTIATSDVANSAITGAKLENNISLPGTGSMVLPSGTTAQRPTTATAGMSRYNTTDNIMEYYNGSTWVRPTAGTTYTGSTSTILNGTSFERAALTGDVTAAQNSNALTIANDAVTSAKILDGTVSTADVANSAVTYAKIQNVSANNRILGRATTGAGTVEEITLGTGLSLTGTTLNAATANTLYSADGTLAGNRTVTQGANTLSFTATATNGFSVDGSTFSVDAANNRVGIGTSFPSDKLHVNGGALLISDATNSGGWIKGYDDHHSIYFREGAGNITNYYEYGGSLSSGAGHVFRTGGLKAIQTTKMQIADDGIYMANNLGIGTNAPSEKLHVVGNIRSSSLAGTGSRMVVADANGVMSTTTIPTSTTYTGSTSVTLNGTSFERAALTGDVTASANSNALTIASNAVTSAKILDGTIATADVANSAITGVKLEDNISLPGTGSMVLPSGTTAQRPVTATAGMSRYNTTDNIMEYFNGTTWVRPTAGTTYTGSTSNVLNGTSFERAALTGDVTSAQNSNALTIANDAVTSAKILDGTIATSDLADASITAAKLNQMSAITGQVMKWNGTAWAAANDENTIADGSETVVTAGSGISIYGAGTTASPYVINANAAIATVTADYTATSSNNTILCNVPGAGMTLTLPSASANTGKVIVIRKIDNDADVLTFSPALNYSTSQTISTLNFLKTITIQSNGSSWWVISE